MLNEKPFRNITNHMNVMLSESEASAGSRLTKSRFVGRASE